MDWNAIGTDVILGIVGVLLTALGTVITYLINKFVKDEKLKKIVQSLNELVQQSVQYVYQTYVEALKDTGMFTVDAQKEALEKCLEKINENMPEDVKNWLNENYSDITAYLKTLIESCIAALKNKSGK